MGKFVKMHMIYFRLERSSFAGQKQDLDTIKRRSGSFKRDLLQPLNLYTPDVTAFQNMVW